VRRLAQQIGISEIHAGCTPKEKADVVRHERHLHNVGIAMVGDGINDAPALAESDVGISMSSGTDLARQSSDVTLLGDDLMRIPWVLGLAGKVCRIIRQNLWWAFGYNSVAVVLAFMGFVHPLIAATAMFASSACVILNSLRILRERTRIEVQ
jgi:P-type E1-E2 ATPase